MDMVAIEDYHRMTTMNEKLNSMKLAHILSCFLVNSRGPFCTITFTSSFLDTRKKQYLSYVCYVH